MGVRHVARMRISERLLIEALHLPYTTRIRGARMSSEFDIKFDIIELLVEHPDLKAVPVTPQIAAAGCPWEIPECLPVMKRNPLVEFVKWGQDDG